MGRHRPTFDEATEVFRPDSVYMERPVMRDGELRWLRVGEIVRGVVVVVWTERLGDTVRIISARFASRVERAFYREYARRNP